MTEDEVLFDSWILDEKSGRNQRIGKYCKDDGSWIKARRRLYCFTIEVSAEKWKRDRLKDKQNLLVFY